MQLKCRPSHPGVIFIQQFPAVSRPGSWPKCIEKQSTEFLLYNTIRDEKKRTQRMFQVPSIHERCPFLRRTVALMWGKAWNNIQLHDGVASTCRELFYNSEQVMYDPMGPTMSFAKDVHTVDTAFLPVRCNALFSASDTTFLVDSIHCPSRDDGLNFNRAVFTPR